MANELGKTIDPKEIVDSLLTLAKEDMLKVALQALEEARSIRESAKGLRNKAAFYDRVTRTKNRV